MIWNEKVLFLHVPKTAGMSMTELLQSHLQGHVRGTEPSIREKKQKGGVTWFQGKRHENLFDAESFFTYRNRSIFQFARIFAVMRNPYDLEVSRYYYLRKGKAVDRGPAQQIALECSFAEYLQKAPFFGQNPPRLDKYFVMGTLLPANLVVLRYENLSDDIHFHLAPYLDVGDAELPHVNRSKRPDYASLYDAESEAACYRRHPWFFDKGFYSRMAF